jgi:hypothetical protein
MAWLFMKGLYRKMIRALQYSLPSVIVLRVFSVINDRVGSQQELAFILVSPKPPLGRCSGELYTKERRLMSRAENNPTNSPDPTDPIFIKNLKLYAQRRL